MATATSSILAKYPDFEATIGIEVHVQLQTNSKIFCACPNKFGQAPNTNICQICAGHPGTLPVLNKKVVDFGIMAGIATNCTVQPVSDFARKHYFYPDLPKKYQLTQDKKPICLDGHILINLEDGSEKKIRIQRIHIEEDAGKNIHAGGGESLVDLNRAGTPLLEIVTHPDIKSSDEARAYLTKLHAIVRCLEISDGNMEEGSFRADINISVKKKTATEFGTRVELKNINSFKFIVQAIEYELERHLTMIHAGERIRMETRLWDSKNHKTYFMRSKEDAQDYKFFTDPDLPELHVSNEWLEAMRQAVPELPDAKSKRFQKEYTLSEYEADILSSEKELALFFENTVAASKLPKLVSNWILRDVLGYVKEQKTTINDMKLTPAHLADLVMHIDKGTINSKGAQEVFIEMMATNAMPSVIIKEKGLEQMDSSDELEAIVKKIVAENPANVGKFKSGNDRIFAFFVGQAMQATQGKANPNILADLFKKHLS